MLQTIEECFAEHGDNGCVRDALSCLKQVIQQLGTKDSAKGSSFEPVVISSLVTKNWTVGQLLDTFEVPKHRPAWCRVIAGYVIQNCKSGTADEHGYANDLEWLQKAPIGHVLKPNTLTGPGRCLPDHHTSDHTSARAEMDMAWAWFRFHCVPA